MRFRSRTCLLLAATLLVIGASSVHAQDADLGVSKTGPATSTPGTDVTYTVDVVNAGPDPAANVTLSDPLPGTMTFVSAAQVVGPVFSCLTPVVGAGGTISCSIASLPAGSAAQFSFVLRIPADATPGETFTNIAAITSDVADPNEENNAGAAATVVAGTPNADVGVQKSTSARAGPDTDVPYTITVQNAGPDAATAVTLTDGLPGNMTFVSLVQTSGPTMACLTPAVGGGGAVSCTIGSLAANAVATFTLTGHVPSGTGSGTTYQNTATVTTSALDPNPENDTATVESTVSAADLAIVVSGPPTGNAGANVSYALVVTNNGPDVALNAVVVDLVPSGTRFVSLVQNSGPPASCAVPTAGGTGAVTCSYAFLASGASAQFTLTLNSASAASIVNTATVTADGFDPNAGNDSSSATTTVVQFADLAITKVAPASASAFLPVPFTLTITNAGPSNAANVALTDVLPAALGFASLQQTSGAPFACTTPAAGANGTVSCTIATLASGASAAFTLTTQLLAPGTVSDGTILANTAAVASGTSDPVPANNAATSSITIAHATDVGVSQTGPSSVAPGSEATFVLTVANAGPALAADLTLTDVLPQGFAFRSLQQTSGPAFVCSTPAVGVGGSIECSIAQLAAGASATLALSIAAPTIPAGAAAANTITVAMDTPDLNPGNNTSTISLALAAAAPIPALSPASLAVLSLLMVVAAGGPRRRLGRTARASNP